MTTKSLKMVAILLVATLLSSCQGASEGKSVTDFNFGWKFSLADTIDQPLSAVDIDDSQWQRVRIPHDWSIEQGYSLDHTSGSNAFLPGGIGWYRKSFTLPKGYAGKNIFIRFEGIYNNAKVWINGEYLGKSINGYLDIEYDLTPYLNKRGENTLAVEVDRRAYADSRWYVGAGIYRNVHLIARDDIYIPTHGIFVNPQLGEGRAEVSIETKLLNTTPATATLNIEQEILLDGASIQKINQSYDAATADTVMCAMTMSLENPTLWSMDLPKMYELRTNIYHNDQLVDTQVTPFGVRSIAFDANEGFLLNGKSVKIKGVNIHHDLGCVGVALYDAVLYRRLAKLRDMGCNAIRTAHNPHSESLLNMCDTMGLFVMNEFIDEWKKPKGKWLVERKFPNAPDSLAIGYSAHFENHAEHDIKRFVERDRNHPSVMLWSIGNEIEWSYPYYWASSLDNKGFGGLIHTGDPETDNAAILERFNKLSKGHDELSITATNLSKWVKEVDPTRPLTSGVVIPSVSRLSGYTAALDVVGYNYKDHYYEVDHKRFPDQPILGTENVGQYFEWKAVADKPYIPGIFVWTGVDYLGENGPWPIKGALYSFFDFCSFKTPRGHFFETLWNDTPKTHIVTTPASESEFKLQPDGSFKTVLRKSPLRRWEWFDTYDKWSYAAGEPIVVQVYTNATEVELQLNGKSLGTKKRADFAEENILLWQLPYSEGALVAIGKEGGKEVSRYTLQSAGEVAEIRVTADKQQVKADGYDLAHLEIELVDANGTLVTDSDQEITLSLDNHTDLIGIDNGSYLFVGKHHDTPSIPTYKGRALAIVQPTAAGKSSTITITTAKGLKQTITLN